MARRPTYDYKPSTHFIGNARFNGKRLQRILGGITKNIDEIVTQEAYKSLNSIAPKLVYDVAQKRGFNSYTGAMAYAYGAALVLDGKQVGVYEMNNDALRGVKPPPATISFSRTGRAYARMQERPKHGGRYYVRKRRYKHYHGTWKYSRVYSNKFYKTRYLKPFETLVGYNKRGSNNRRTRVEQFNAYKKQRKNLFNKLFYLQVFNAAPYAAMVEAGIPSKGIPGYNVISGGKIRGSMRKYKYVVRDTTTKMIERALHNYCKDWRSSKGSEPTAKIYSFRNEGYD